MTTQMMNSFQKYPSVSVYTYKFDSTHPEDGWQSQSPSLMQLTLSCPMKLELNGKLVHEMFVVCLVFLKQNFFNQQQAI